jgi:hypothetical protein
MVRCIVLRPARAAIERVVSAPSFAAFEASASVSSVRSTDDRLAFCGWNASVGT